MACVTTIDVMTSTFTTTHTTTDVATGDHSIHLTRTGDPHAEKILFLHGSGPGATGMSNFAHTISVLGEHYDCLVIDQIGWGDSSHPDTVPDGGRISQNVEASLGLLDTLGIERTHVIGNSMGGAVMLGLLDRAPERFGRAIGLGAAGAGNMGAPTPAMMKLFRFYDDPTPQAMRVLTQTMLYDPDLFGDRLDTIAAERLAVALRPDVRRSHELSFGSPRAGAAFVGEDALRQIPNDVLFVHGREDVTVPPAGSAWFADVVPNGRLYQVPHCAHWVQIEQATIFENITHAFLSGGI